LIVTLLSGSLPASDELLTSMDNSNCQFLQALACGWLALAPLRSAGVTREASAFGAIPDDGRDDAAAIQKAIEASSAGDTLRLPAGTYLVDRTLRARSGVKILGAGRDCTFLKFNAGTETDFFDLSGSRGVELCGFTLEGNGDLKARHGIVAHSGGGHFIHDLTIQNLGSPHGPLGIHLVGDGGNYTHGVTDCTIADNTLRNIGLNSEWGGGIRLSWGSSRNQILRNVVDNTGRGGIFADNGSSDLRICGNTITRSGRKAEKLGIEVWGNCDRVLLEDNRVDHWLSISGCSRVAARRNTVTAPSGDIAFIGLELIGQDLAVTDNLVDGGQQIGISLSNNANNQRQYCAYNVVRNMVQWGVQLQGDQTGAKMLYYYKNQFLATQRGNSAAIYPGADGRGFRFNGNCQQVTLDGNVISHNPAEGLELGGKDLEQLSFINNLISQNGFAAVTGNAGANLEWTNNTVTGNGRDEPLTSRGFAHRRPTADFMSSDNPTAGQPVIFGNRSAAAEGSIKHVLWDFGEGVPATLPEGVHTYDRPGTYRVTLIVWDDQGRGAIKEREVTINAARENR
jgi:hypothetical protein